MDGLTYDIIVDYGTPSSNDPNVFFSDPPPKRRQAACHNMDPNWKWSANSPVHFIAHSQGGNTCRYLIHLLDNGFNADSTFLEKGSQYFTTPQKGWVKSLTTLATPHNGSSVINALDVGIILLLRIMCDLFVWQKIGPVQENVLNKFILTAALKEPKTRIFDFCLDHRGICPPPSRATKESAHKTELTSEKGALTLWRRSKFNGFHDNSIPGTIGQLNKIIREPSPDVYYFTLSTASTTSVFKNDFKKLRAFGNGLADGLNAHLPRSLPSFSGVGTTMTRPGTFVGFQPMAPYMCAYRPSPDEETMIEQAGGPINPHDWHEHDGVVPTCSMAGPFGNPRVDVADIVRHGGGLKHGIWVNLGKEGSVDHAACIGVGAGDEMQELYVRISKLLSVLP